MLHQNAHHVGFFTFGPFDYADGMQNADFWSQVGEQSEEYGFKPDAITNAIGCYLFVTTFGKTSTPWYVGH